MKIAQLVSNIYAVSDSTNHAIYSHVGWLSKGLKNSNNEVVLYASGDSKVNCELRSVYPTALGGDETLSDRQRQHYTRLLISKCFDHASEFDLIHTHFSLLSSFHARQTKTPVLISVHSPFDDEIKPFLHEFRNLRYVSFSLSQRRLMPELNWYANIYHGVDTEQFSFNASPENYLLYLGRVTEDKGVHLAIAAAKAAGIPLVIVGRSFPQEGYWHAEIEKHVDGDQINYVGEKSFEEKISWLRNAKALLFPTQVQEAFGYSMIEALSCGTPVIAWNNGSVPEVVKHEKTGFVVYNLEEMIAAIKKIDQIDRQNCRNRATQYFSIEKMISGYLNVYGRLLSENHFQQDKEKQRAIQNGSH